MNRRTHLGVAILNGYEEESVARRVVYAGVTHERGHQRSREARRHGVLALERPLQAVGAEVVLEGGVRTAVQQQTRCVLVTWRTQNTPRVLV